ncbi:hypothetical protein CEXT_547461 [Caerostris extrusa]|uniref:Uncharacterized protein n=1 Tax=Caerostris extrusa TaxID=172846 RepID=A0AAV4UG64_CAEEX|nr:hypothetical protein CEXT_547461 [Caerostris extrusa]
MSHCYLLPSMMRVDVIGVISSVPHCDLLVSGGCIVASRDLLISSLSNFKVIQESSPLSANSFIKKGFVSSVSFQDSILRGLSHRVFSVNLSKESNGK